MKIHSTNFDSTEANLEALGKHFISEGEQFDKTKWKRKSKKSTFIFNKNEDCYDNFVKRVFENKETKQQMYVFSGKDYFNSKTVIVSHEDISGLPEIEVEFPSSLDKNAYGIYKFMKSICYTYYDNEEKTYLNVNLITPIMHKDAESFGIEFDWENPPYFDGAQDIKKAPNGQFVVMDTVWGDWETPIKIIIYLDNKGQGRIYIPKDGNVYNKATKSAFGNDWKYKDEDDKMSDLYQMKLLWANDDTIHEMYDDQKMLEEFAQFYDKKFK